MTDEQPRRYSRSPSQLKSVTRCGTAFYLERIARPKPPRVPAAWTILGLVVHEVFQKWEESERTIDVLEYFDGCWERILAEEMEKQPDLRVWQKAPNAKTVENDIKNYKKRGLTKDVPTYLERRLEAKWEVLRLPDGQLALELPVDLVLGDVQVKGYIDMLQWWPESGLISVEDLKTGSPDDEEDERQLAFYRIGALYGYDVNLTSGRYWYTKLDRPSNWVDLTRFDVDYLTEQYNILDKIIDQQLFLPKPGKTCQLCSVRPYCPEKGWLQLGQPLFDKEENDS